MNTEQFACLIIGSAGDSRSSSLEALQLAGERKYDEAKKKLEEAEKSLLDAHREHTKLLVADAQENSVVVTLLLAHASDHLANAETIHDLVEQMIIILEDRDNV
ncbi:MAG: PTS lactose/cellobiose transporter subunit IIA [Erysipelotrichia bacterium]|nr:PTS lactose/cellobiose transporter subunit IIA [Erysipelotrichia bacterium]